MVKKYSADSLDDGKVAVNQCDVILNVSRINLNC